MGRSWAEYMSTPINVIDYIKLRMERNGKALKKLKDNK
jgi:hypothetical protein